MEKQEYRKKDKKYILTLENYINQSNTAKHIKESERFVTLDIYLRDESGLILKYKRIRGKYSERTKKWEFYEEEKETGIGKEKPELIRSQEIEYNLESIIEKYKNNNIGIVIKYRIQWKTTRLDLNLLIHNKEVYLLLTLESSENYYYTQTKYKNIQILEKISKGNYEDAKEVYVRVNKTIKNILEKIGIEVEEGEENGKIVYKLKVKYLSPEIFKNEEKRNNRTYNWQK